jgi:beta-glucosidase/6-phospho-beta-glucosidase/beta-galactosidase
MAGKLPEFLCPPDCVGQQDFVGLDYYWGISTLRINRIQALIEAGLGRFDRAPVWPGVLYDHLKYQAGLFPHLPLLIVENGSVDVADKVDRATYLSQHIGQVQRAAQDGVNVIGYVCWAITSNREWGLPFGASSDFGLYHIELDTDPALTRVPTPAVAVYQDIIARRGASETP